MAIRTWAILVAGSALAWLIFAFRLQVAPVAGLVLAAGPGVGGYLGILATIRQSERWNRRVVLFHCAALAIRLLLG